MTRDKWQLTPRGQRTRDLAQALALLAILYLWGALDLYLATH